MTVAVRSMREVSVTDVGHSAETSGLLIRRDEIMLTAEAATHSGKSEKTIRRWCTKYRISRQSAPNAPLQISRIGLEMVLHGDWPALERLLAGDREHRLVRWYRSFIGLPET